MPEGFEYLHCVQAALDTSGFRYQVLDTNGRVRERSSWPVNLAPPDAWIVVEDDRLLSGLGLASPGGVGDRIVAWRFRGRAAGPDVAGLQTLLSAMSADSLAPLWLGLKGPRQQLTVSIGPEIGRSPHYWQGPGLSPGELFDIQVMLHAGMGPGGILYRTTRDGAWSSFRSVSPWGVERLAWPEAWLLGHGQYGPSDRRFQGSDLMVTMTMP
jgi:hypothetical protein